MWHVADGELHAYLDGAMDLYPADEAKRIRSHLETCAECGHRLEDEARLRERAAAVLQRTGPATVEPPPFEEVRRQAAMRAGEASPGTRVPWVVRLGWAASVVVALGGGWMLGQEIPGSEGVAGGEAPTDPWRVIRSAMPGEERAAAEREPAAEIAATDTGAPTEAEVAVEEELAAGRVPGGERVAEASRPATPVVGADASSLPAVTALGDELRSTMKVELGADVLDTVARAQELAFERLRRPDSLAAMDVIQRATGDQVDSMARVGVTREQRREAEGVEANAADARARALLLPGLEVLQVEWTEVAPGLEGLRVVQRLAGDTTRLELRFVGLPRADAGAVGAAEAAGARIPEPPPGLVGEALPEGVVQVVEPLPGGGWVAVRGRLSEARLRRLLELLR